MKTETRVISDELVEEDKPCSFCSSSATFIVFAVTCPCYRTMCTAHFNRHKTDVTVTIAMWGPAQKWHCEFCGTPTSNITKYSDLFLSASL